MKIGQLSVTYNMMWDTVQFLNFLPSNFLCFSPFPKKEKIYTTSQ